MKEKVFAVNEPSYLILTDCGDDIDREPQTIKSNPSKLPHLAYLDGWRGAAIFTLLIGHFAPIRGIHMGRVGVELFFVLSGRLMAEILFIRNVPLGDFFRRRFARIWPALLIFILLVTLLSQRVTWLDALKVLTFTINYWSGNGFVHHTWSLCVEEHSYIILAIAAFAVRKWAMNPLLILLPLAIGCVINGIIQSTLVANSSYYTVYWHSDVRAASIFLAAAAYLYFTERTVASWFPIAMGVLGMMLQTNFLPDFIKYSLGSAMLAICMATIGRAKSPVLGVLSNRILTMAGTFSYSIYLWQQPFYKLGVAKLYPCIIICAILSFYLVEKPAREYIVALKLKR